MSSPPTFDPTPTEANLVCVACGTQFPTTDPQRLPTCFICDDPRQYTSPTGQTFTTVGALRAAHTNTFTPLARDARLVSIVTEPKFAIGQRAILVCTPAGNVLWDCLTLLDGATVARIRALGGLAAMVVSHPHYYSAHAEWAAAFGCPVLLAGEDREWLAQASERHVFVEEGVDAVPDVGGVPGVTAIKLGGHFPGSMVLLYDGRLLVADTLLTTPAGLGSWEVDALGQPRKRPEGMNSFAFMWSIPNSIPLSGDEVFRMWGILQRYQFRSTHGAFLGQEMEADDIRARVLDSMKIQTKAIGWVGQATWDEVGN